VRDLLPSGSNFLRGLSIGALVGAAIAGSTIWQHRHQRRQARDAAMASGPDASPAQAAETRRRAEPPLPR
jgi:predicted anti-sigma-YlaC factor YlaD